jgi:23S rRNA (cytidine2498-2'-O)-methyltransferase
VAEAGVSGAAAGTATGRTGYLAAPGFLQPLREELGGAAREVLGDLVLADGPPIAAAWAQNIWYDVREIPCESIQAAARALRALQRNWVLYSLRAHRRAHLIEAALPHITFKPLVFGDAPKSAPLGSWTLASPTRLLAAPRCSSPFPHGAVRFVEAPARASRANRIDAEPALSPSSQGGPQHSKARPYSRSEAPPARAYLKLWEALTRFGVRPAPGERCIDLGASPGGWTWVLASLGARVVSVDRAPLAPRIARMPGVETVTGSAFGEIVRERAPFDWLFSDVVCYPAKLLEHVRGWLAMRAARRYVCTIKFQGATQHDVARAFAEIPGSTLVHLWHNKHELTWFCAPKSLSSDST